MYGQSEVVMQNALALGLLLERPLFEGYDQNVREANEKLPSSDDPVYRSIDFDPHQDVSEQFRQESDKGSRRQEATFDAWIRSIDTSEPQLVISQPKGNHTPLIVFNKGECGSYPFREKKRFDVTGPLTFDNIEDEDDDEENVDTSKLAEM